MGKIPPSFRSAISTSMATKPSSLATINPPSAAAKPLHFPKKPARFSRKTHDPNSLESPSPSPSVPPQLQSPFTSPDLSDAKKLFSSVVAASKSPLDARLHNALLQSYAAVAATVHDSISLLNHMVKASPCFSPDRSTYHVLLSQSCKTPGDSLSPVHQVLNLMINRGVAPNQATADVAVRSLCSSGREDEAIELIRELSSKHSPPDTYTYNFVVKHLCKNRALGTAYNFIDEMRDSLGVKPDLVTYTILIDNVCNTKNLREVTRLVSVLSEEGFKPDCFVYNTIMKGYCMLSRGSEAVGVYKKMKEEGVEPDLVTYNTLIFGLSKSGRVKDARKYLDIMVEAGHFPDAVTYTSLMNGMCREGDALGALRLLEEMEAKGCSPNSCTYNTLLHGLCKSRLLEKGIELYQMMKSSDMKLETAAYATFVRSLCRDGRVAEAYEVFDYAVESKSLTDVSAYTALESSLKWLKKAREQGLAV
ncbi:pentatricopeptide repeat-containing protein At2g17670 [Syzygium oleosum]|uniref:pentatricopeptide repeat-containing protein At2g17670 n=1 Tax=Syzygium oleosum TaxID=219896 RepID=UPI0024BAB6EB|nr:pentatricopeptide repeat-containing protein At2g17670 [Syzygium oleosum]XP_030469403.2 pentatricopeptide repeat-containing protein At2g17670 [Syzygium oleosum]